jgi:imidazolonepropionase-like amidohydrolase
VADGAAGVTIVSALAHAGTRNLDALFVQRQAAGLGDWQTQVRRYASSARLAPGRGPVVLGSAPSGLPPGIAQHAELRALVEAGLGPFEALRAATVDAASALGLGLTLGRIATGAEANFLLIQGDPLASIEDAAKLVGVVQNGRFVSLSRLLDNVDAN